MNRLASLVVLGLVLAGPAAAQKVYGPGGTTIYPIDGAVFEVVGPPSDKTMWCGAAKYARQAKVGWKTPIVVVRAPEASALEDGRRQGTRFTVAPQAAGVTPTGEGRALSPGTWQTVSIANRNCVRLDNPSDR